MKIKILIIGLILVCLKSFGQVKELEKFRKEITTFVNYDNGKIDSLPKSPETSEQLTKNYENAFLDFIKKKDSKNLDNLKKNSIDNKTSHIIGNRNYFFHSLRRDPFNKSLENNVNYQITFYGLYDYKLSNFVSFYIQPFLIDNSDYVVYYYTLNGKGTYYIKNVKSNKIMFKSQGLTSYVPIKKIKKIDNNHILIVEDMGDNGERALVINTELKKWKAIEAFYGKAFFDNSTDYTKTTEIQKRVYFNFTATRTINAIYGRGFLKKYEIDFDENTKTISYKKPNKKDNEIKVIEAKWKNNLFNIDDYYIGQDVHDKDLPMPGY